MADFVQSLSVLLASLALALAFVAAWFEPSKKTPGTLLGLAALATLTFLSGRAFLQDQNYINFSMIPEFLLGSQTHPGVISLSAYALAAIGVLFYSRRPVTMIVPDSPLKLSLKKNALALHRSQSVTDSILRCSLGAKLVMDVAHSQSGPTFTIRMVNGSIEQLFGHPSSKLIGARLDKVCPSYLYPWIKTVAEQAMATHLPCQDERRFDVKHTQWYEMRAVAFPSGVTMTIADITDRRRIEDALRLEANTDPLTGLANRSQLKASLAEIVHRVSMRPGRGLTLMYLDFDRFKIVNDSLGHDIGDELLCSIAQRLREAVDAQSNGRAELLAARLGGDEFVILLEGMSDPVKAEEFADNLIERLSKPHDIGIHSLVSTASIGLVTDNGVYKRAEDLLRDADMAMYAAKEAGKAQYVVFDASLREKALSAATLESDLRYAIDHGELRLAYQPIIDLRTGAIHSFEALVRWDHATRGLVYPDQFIPMAEELGIIQQIGEQVLYMACNAAKELKEVTSGETPITISVNHSKRELLSGKFIQTVADILSETKIDAGLIKIEVTESVCVKHQATVVPVLNGLRSLGVQTVIDDFGTGDSSFSCIEQFPLDQLKIDRRFLQSSRDMTTRKAILGTMIEMAQSLGVPAVCEGIETKEELDLILELNCDLGQGWVFAEAMDLPDALQLATSGLSRWIENLPLLDAINENAKKKNSQIRDVA